MSKKDRITYIRAREILDSRGYPTVEVMVTLEGGMTAKASVPAGATMGEHEAWELRDNDPNRYAGSGVLRACEHVNQDISAALAGYDVCDQEGIDRMLVQLDGTPNKGKLGANAILGTSLACARAGAAVTGVPVYLYVKKLYHFPSTAFRLPVPMFNVFSGGKHADTNLDFQEFMIVPRGITSARTQVRAATEIFHKLGRVLLQQGLDTDVGIEGGYAPDIDASVDAMKYMLAAIDEAGYHAGSDIQLAIDAGATSFYDEQKQAYLFRLDESFLGTDQLISLYRDWLRAYPIFSIEDGLDQNDWHGWKQMTRELTHGSETLVVGDDVFATNVTRLNRGIAEGIGNAIVVKPNQVGTLTEAIQCVRAAQEAQYQVVVSQRSGDTNDDSIVDLGVAVGAEYLKGGSLSRGERVSKYNRLMEIEMDLE